MHLCYSLSTYFVTSVFVNISLYLSLQTPHNDQTKRKQLTIDHLSTYHNLYEIQNDTYNLIVLSASYQDDGVFECSVGIGEAISNKWARIFIYGKA